MKPTQYAPATGAGLLIAVGIAFVVLVFLYSTGLGAVVVGAALATAVLYTIYVLAVNLHRWATTRYDRGR